MKQYQTPDFDVTAYEVEDIITLSFGSVEQGGGVDKGWVEV